MLALLAKSPQDPECAEGEHFKNEGQRAMLREVLPLCGIWFHNRDYPDLGPAGEISRCTRQMLDGSTNSQSHIRRVQAQKQKERIMQKFGAEGFQDGIGISGADAKGMTLAVQHLYAKQLTSHQRCAAGLKFS